MVVERAIYLFIYYLFIYLFLFLYVRGGVLGLEDMDGCVQGLCYVLACSTRLSSSHAISRVSCSAYNSSTALPTTAEPL